VRLYLDSGTAGEGQDDAPETRRMFALLKSLRYKEGKEILHFEDEGAEHNEEFWRKRLHIPLLFLFGNKN